MSSKRREEKAITIKLTQEEYDKIVKLAEIRHMNPTEYARHSALGNRIKPTIVSEVTEKNEIVITKDNLQSINQMVSLIDVKNRKVRDNYFHLFEDNFINAQEDLVKVIGKYEDKL